MWPALLLIRRRRICRYYCTIFLMANLGQLWNTILMSMNTTEHLYEYLTNHLPDRYEFSLIRTSGAKTVMARCTETNLSWSHTSDDWAVSAASVVESVLRRERNE